VASARQFLRNVPDYLSHAIEQRRVRIGGVQNPH
jgi:hypothetical protein